jgi:hypothetical protein
MLPAPGCLPTFAQVLDDLAAAERRDGWLIECEQRDCYLALNRQLIEALAAAFRSLGSAPVLEVCAGDGRLAGALIAAGIPVIATDAAPRGERGVEPLSAIAALSRHRPAVVLGAFVPLDAGIDAAVLETASVQHYLVLNARLGGALGATTAWGRSGWHAQRQDEITRWMITRHDVWLDDPAHPLIQHGEAWLLSRIAR